MLATQTIWQKKPRTMRITIDGALGPHVSAKDVVLAIVARLGIGGAVGHAIEYAGSTVDGMSIEARGSEMEVPGFIFRRIPCKWGMGGEPIACPHRISSSSLWV